MALRESGLGRAYYRCLEAWVLPLVARTGVSPSGLSLLGVLVAALVPAAFWLHPFAGVGCMLVSGVLDNLDGLLSRARSRTGPYGEFLDSTLDRIADVFFLTGFWVLLWEVTDLPVVGTLSVLGCLAVTLLIGYTKERIESLGVTCTGGIFGRPERVILLLLLGSAVGVFPGQAERILFTGLWVYLVLGVLTLGQRFRLAGHKLKK
ncbi:MAG: CDP-alcohol phosphatidyltransferase family protein [Desulfohalobiaceae bacterium]